MTKAALRCIVLGTLFLAVLERPAHATVIWPSAGGLLDRGGSNGSTLIQFDAPFSGALQFEYSAEESWGSRIKTSPLLIDTPCFCDSSPAYTGTLGYFNATPLDPHAPDPLHDGYRTWVPYTSGLFNVRTIDFSYPPPLTSTFVMRNIAIIPAVVTPEPATLLLVLTGLAIAVRRRLITSP